MLTWWIKEENKVTVVFVCNKYSPAHVYTIEAYKKIFENNEIGSFLLDDFLVDKDRMSSIDIEHISIEQLNVQKDRDILFFFVSPHIDNIKTIKAIRKRIEEAKIIYLYHEPMTKQMSREILQDRGFSLRSLKYIFGLSYFNGRRLIKKTDYVILPSNNANTIYEKDRVFKKHPHSVIHLLFERNFNFENKPRNYFSYIGTIANNHGFFEFVKYLLETDRIQNNLRALIATSSKIDDEIVQKLIDKYGNQIVLKHGSFLSDEEIAKMYSETMVLWLGYKHSSQSGVLPMAFMYGAPALCSNIDSFKEFAVEGKNSEYVDIEKKSSIDDAIDKIQSNFEKYRLGCLDTYEVFFNHSNKSEQVVELFTKIAKSGTKDL